MRNILCFMIVGAFAVRAAEDSLGESGRVLLRPSGTEPLMRVMVEGQDRHQVESLAAELARCVEEAAGDGDTANI